MLSASSRCALLALCLAGCHAQPRAERAIFKTSAYGPHEVEVQGDRCVVASRELLIMRRTDGAHSAIALSTGEPLWRAPEARATLVACDERGVLLLERDPAALTQRLVLRDYARGALVEEATWQAPAVSGRRCDALATAPLPGETVGFLWRLSPQPARRGYPISDEQERAEQEAHCCRSGVTTLTGGGATTQIHATQVGPTSSSACELVSDDATPAERAARQEEQQAMFRDSAQARATLIDADPSLSSLSPIARLDDGGLLVFMIFGEPCERSHATLARLALEQGRWHMRWSVPTYDDASARCPVP